MNADGESGALWGRNSVDVGPALLRKLKKGGALIGISVNEEYQIRDVKSLVWRDQGGVSGDYRGVVLVSPDIRLRRRNRNRPPRAVAERSPRNLCPVKR